ncbi:MAG: hypothetical protein V3W33_07495 [Gammaproteobacteria bacterium]
MAENDLGDLERLNILIALEVRQAMQASIVMIAAAAAFAGNRKWFVQNPANTLPFAALQALEKGATVTIAEVLKAEHGTFPVTMTIRRKADLIAHRNSISHPVTVKWRRPEMQAFSDGHREWLDLRPALIWDMQRSINEELKRAGRRVWNDEVNITPEMAMLLELIFKLSARPEALPYLSAPTEDMQASLQEFRDNYLDFLVEHPDGQT